MTTNKTDNEKFFQKIDLPEAPVGLDRRAFLMRHVAIGAAAVMTGCSAQEKAAQVGAAPPPAASATLSPDLNVVKKAKGPVITTIDEFYKVGPGPSSSHTIGPMRITYDFTRAAQHPPPATFAGHS